MHIYVLQRSDARYDNIPRIFSTFDKAYGEMIRQSGNVKLIEKNDNYSSYQTNTGSLYHYRYMIRKILVDE